MIVKRKGFTLVEILVSLSLFSLIMGLVFSSVQNSKEHHRYKVFLQKIEDLFLIIHSATFEEHRSHQIIFDFSLFLVSTKVSVGKEWLDKEMNVRIPLDLVLDWEKMQNQKKKYVLTIDRDGLFDEFILFLKRKKDFLIMKINAKEGFSCERRKSLF